jgi:hypothetical protein
VLPGPTRFEVLRANPVILTYREAKDLAVGFSSNDESQYDENKPGVQDNSYWGITYHQSKYNLKIWIPSSSEVSLRTLRVTGWTNSEHIFTFGELVSLYGDYRRTVHCDDRGRCYLTNRDDPQYQDRRLHPTPGYIYFEEGNYPAFKPAPRLTSNYLRYIGSGLVPPFGRFGNVTDNTADYEDEELEAGWWGDELMRIANTNDWHFSRAAIAWYIGMHRLALLYVEKARTDNRYWNQALHYEANALHSLTDLFAFGHIVTNRERTSWQVMSDEGLLGREPYVWAENVIRMGGGRRDLGDYGRLELDPAFPLIQDVRTPRNDFMPSYIGNQRGRGAWETTYHDRYNEAGATVINLKRQEFTIYGDFGVPRTDPLTQQIIAEAVRASLQSLFDAYESTASIEEIGRVGSAYFAALLSVPVYVKTDLHSDHLFERQWTRYAKMVDAVVNAGVVPANACEMPYVDGEYGVPSSNPGSCDFAPPPLNPALVVEELLSSNGALRWADRAYLDTHGNGNNGYDVGDFLRWVRATGATPSAVLGVRP